MTERNDASGGFDRRSEIVALVSRFIDAVSATAGLVMCSAVTHAPPIEED